ncbi:MAG: DUF3794 domain-containing protein [Oscillospiraceae bacterium]|jgi:LysM repeat protein|nr:DUF3794 domain-containing protein [Oscillospiraceae bacterium]
MECKLIQTEVNVNEIVYEGSAEQSIDLDIVLPDYCPDIGKILKCQVVPSILAKDISGDTLNVEGNAAIRIFYADDEKRCLRSFEQEFPFSTSLNVKNVGESASAFVKAKADYVNCRAVSQRKLDIHGAVTVKAAITNSQPQELISDVCGAGINLKKQTVPISSLVNAVQQQFGVSETLEIGSAKPPIGSIVRSDAVVFPTEYKAIANKLILKGEAIVRALYRSDLDETQFETLEFNIPVNQFIDVPGLEDTSACDVALEAAYLKLTPKTDNDGEYKMVGLDLRIGSTVKAYDDQEVSLISDAYSTEYELIVDSRPVHLEKLIKNVSDNYIVRDTQEFAGALVKSVTDIWCDLSDLNSKVQDGKLSVKGNVNFNILAEDEDNEPIFVERLSPFEYECPAGDASAAKAEARAQIASAGFSFAGDNKLDLKAEVKLNAPVYSVTDIRSINQITPDESQVKALTQQPALNIYYADKGEALWDIARKHNSSVDKIKEENELTDDTLGEDKMLLISI